MVPVVMLEPLITVCPGLDRSVKVTTPEKVMVSLEIVALPAFS